MRIAIVGPTHPYKGGVALHTTELAHRLQAAGHDVELISWKRQYPQLLYPGVQRVPFDKPEMPLFPHSSEQLNWFDPGGWLRLGRRLRHHDLVILAFFVPQFQGSAGLAMMQAMGKKRHPKVIAICHNVLQHDQHLGEKQITRLFLSRVDRVIVHSQKEAERAREFTKKAIRVAQMAAHLPEAARIASTHKHTKNVQNHLLFFGLIRKYKGVDVLLEALAEAQKDPALPKLRLTIVGEPRGSLENDIRNLIQTLHLTGQVTFKPGYLPADELPPLFAKADALVLPYRSGTGTQNIAMAFAHGIPVIATRAATMAKQVHEGVDGLLCKPGDVASLAKCIRHFYQPKILQHLQDGLPNIANETTKQWKAYLETMLSA